MSRVANFDTAASRLDASRDLLTLSLQSNPVLCFGQLIKAATVVAQESLKFFLSNVVFGNDAALNGFLNSEKNKLCDEWLGEDAGWCLAFPGAGLVLDGVRGTVASTARRRLDSL